MTTPRAFGVEQEHFVLHDDSTPPTHSEIDQLWDSLRSDGYLPRATNRQGVVLAIEGPSAAGPVVITNDSCTNILEVAFPKLRSLADFQRMYDEVWGLVEARLSGFGLRIVRKAALPNGLKGVQWRSKESDPDGERLYKFVHRLPLNDPLFCPEIPACVTATQVSLEIADIEAIARLTAYYAFEFLVPLLFSSSPEFQGVTAHCARPLAIVANFRQPYPLLGIPSPIPATMAEYEALQATMESRDYSFVSIRSRDRLEFRSADSQPSGADVTRLVRFRLAVDRAVTAGVTGEWSPHSTFEAACLGKTDLLPTEAALESLAPFLAEFELDLHSLGMRSEKVAM